MRHLAVITALALAGCNATMPQQQASRPTARDDPSAMCFQTIRDNPRIQILSKHLTIGDLRSTTMEMLADNAKPTDDEKAALSIWAQHRQACAESGRNFRAQYAPPGWVSAFEAQQAAFLQAIASLYSGEYTYGQFNAQRQRLATETQAKLEAADRNAQQQQATQQQVQQAQALQSLQTMQILQSMQPRPMPMPMPTIAPTVVCNTRPSLGGTQTVCN